LRPVLELLAKSGLRGQRVDDAMNLGAPMTALLHALVATLECVGWKHRDFKGQWPGLAAAAAREIMRILKVGRPWRWTAQGVFLRWVLWLADRVLPFDFEAYLEYHFTKVGPQTRAALQAWVAQGQASAQPTPALVELARSMARREQGLR
jgi:2-dehydropantoate 2-reductase